MMHEREKSDPAIGAGKPTNKAKASKVADAAEPVEQRAGAKGNASGQSTHRTQGRERVSQALERVRQAARLRKEEKFTALLHHVNLSNPSTEHVALHGSGPGTLSPSLHAPEGCLLVRVDRTASGADEVLE